MWIRLGSGTEHEDRLVSSWVLCFWTRGEYNLTVEIPFWANVFICAFTNMYLCVYWHGCWALWVLLGKCMTWVYWKLCWCILCDWCGRKAMGVRMGPRPGGLEMMYIYWEWDWDWDWDGYLGREGGWCFLRLDMCGVDSPFYGVLRWTPHCCALLLVCTYLACFIL